MNEIATANPAHDDARRRIRHNPGCPRNPTYVTYGSRGDEMVRCSPCGRFAVVLATPAPTPSGTPRVAHHSHPEATLTVLTPSPEPRPATVSPASPYRCRDHGSPVTFKGTGCADCNAEHKARMAARVRRGKGVSTP